MPSAVAVLFSGYLNVNIPDAGATSRHFLLNPLKAHTFIAGTARWEDCSHKQDNNATLKLGDCLVERLAGFRPLTAWAVYPMLSIAQLRTRLSRAAQWTQIQQKFQINLTWAGLTSFAPALGNTEVSCLRELLDYHRVYQLMEGYEQQCRPPSSREPTYSRVIFSRLEAAWIVPHPPLSMLDPNILWVQSGQLRVGVNDRYALMSREHAKVYFGRWKLLMSAELFDQVPEDAVLRATPEGFLLNLLQTKNIQLGELPALAWLACCSDGVPCWWRQCVHQPLVDDEFCVNTPVGEIGDEIKDDEQPGWAAASWRPSKALSQLRVASSGTEAADVSLLANQTTSARCLFARGKYDLEIHEVKRLFQAMQCTQVFWRLRRYGESDHVGLYKQALDAVVVTDGRAYVPLAALTPRVQIVHARGTAPENKPILATARSDSLAQRGNQTLLQRIDVQSYMRLVPEACFVNDGRTYSMKSFPMPGACASATDDQDQWPSGDECRVPEWPGPSIASLGECASLCARCSKCKYVSFSAVSTRCLWSKSCDVVEYWGWTEYRLWDVEHVDAREFLYHSPHLRDIFHYRAAPGFCRVTADGDRGDCENGDQGMWFLGPESTLGIVDMGTCVAACRSCRRCNYVSVSLRLHDCSWYHTCNTSALQGPGSEHHTVAVRQLKLG